MKLRRRGTKLAAVVSTLLMAAGLSACAGSSEAKVDKDGKAIIRYNAGGASIIPVELADALGYFENITIEDVGLSQGGPAMIQGVATGTVDVGAPFNSSIIASRAAGVPVKAVIGYLGTNELQRNGFYVLEDSGIKEPKDLLGKKVGLNTLGAAQEAFLDSYLLENGVSGDDLSKVTRVTLPTANFELGLRTGQVDAVPLWSGALVVAQKEGGIRELFNPYDQFGAFTQACLVMSEKFIEANPEVVKDFTQGVAKAIAFTQSHPKEEVIEVYSEWLKEHGRDEEVALAQGWVTTGVANAGGAISDSEFTRWIDWMVAKGEIEEGAVTPAEMYTNEFNPYGENIVPAEEATVE